MRKCMILLSLVAFAAAGTASAQQPAEPPGPRVGDMAPDFTLSGATRYGLLKDPVQLSGYRGSVVVIAFFFQARTRG